MLFVLLLPHARGGEPLYTNDTAAIAGFLPTPVGVNRKGLIRVQIETIPPHARGGEPSNATALNPSYSFLPTPVGVNRTILTGKSRTLCSSPRPWG